MKAGGSLKMKTLIGALFAACLTLMLLSQDRSTSSANQSQNTQQGFHQDLAWSPDGSRISFSWNGEGNFEIYVMQASGSAATNLTRDAASDRYATWSPDGSPRELNCRLSRTRASSVEQAVRRALNRQVMHFSSRGFCSEMPIATEETLQGRNKNRRVE